MKTGIRMVFAALLVAVAVLCAREARAMMTGREFVDMFWARDKLTAAERYVSFFREQGYRDVPDSYALTARMEFNIHRREQYELWLDWLSLMAAKELGMRR